MWLASVKTIKIKGGKAINDKESHTSACMCLSFQPFIQDKATSTLTRQLEAVVIEVSTVQALRQRTNPW